MRLDEHSDFRSFQIGPGRDLSLHACPPPRPSTNVGTRPNQDMPYIDWPWACTEPKSVGEME